MRKTKAITALVLSLGLAFSFGFSAFADQPKVDFIDVSHWNAQNGLPLSFYQTLKADGINAVVVKVSDGQTVLDPAASVNIANAKQAGMAVHAYHYARFKSNADAVVEAKWFDKKLKLTGFDKKKDGQVVVDVEDNSLKSISPSKLTEYTNTFVKTMKDLGYSKIDLYTGSAFYNENLKPKSLSVSKPWLARYSASNLLPNFSNGKGAWQWSQTYKFIGISGYFDVSQDFAGKFTNVSTVPNATQGVKKIGSVSLVDYMKSKNMDASFNARKKLATQYGITNYTGTQAQNLALLSKLKSGVKPAKTNLSNSKLITTTSEVAKETKKFRLITGTFKNKTDLHSAAGKLKKATGWAVYEKESDGLRLMTGTFTGKAEAEQAAAKVKKQFRWIVYVKEV
ncbi:GH25 family lysozyme [Bacillus sp. FSL W8-0223]|uniref:GH25 family lysozyme n=1 Tax=Bacillus sp. FSL W8-0223 TaxID=2954595 RepID=UPI0030FAAEA8